MSSKWESKPQQEHHLDEAQQDPENSQPALFSSFLSSPTELFMQPQSWSAYSVQSFRKPQK